MALSANAILTKVRAMYGRRLTPENYAELLSCSSVSEVANYLNTNTQYNDVLSDLPTGYVKRNVLENALRKHLFIQFESISHFEKAIGQEMYRYFIIRNEIDEIMSCIRLLKTPDKDEYLMKMPVFLNGLTTIDLFRLAKSQNFDDIIKSVSNTDYEKILVPLYPIDENINFPAVEAALFKYLNEKTEELSKKSLPKKEREEFLFALRTVSDLKNITNVYRLKFIYKFSPEQIRNFVLAEVNSNIEPKKKQKIIDAKDIEEFRQAVNSTCYGNDLKKITSYSNIENVCDKFLCEFASKKLRFSTYPAVVMFCWIILAENEIKNIIHLAEAIKYGIEQDEIKKLLIINREGE